MFLKAVKTLLKDPKFRSLLYLVTLTLASGTFFYHSVEGWSWLDSFYFSVITLATVGYGDFTPQTDLGKLFTVLYIFLGLGILVGFVTPIGEYLIDKRMENVDKKVREKENSQTEHQEDHETEHQIKLGFSGVIGKLKGKK